MMTFFPSARLWAMALCFLLVLTLLHQEATRRPPLPPLTERLLQQVERVRGDEARMKYLNAWLAHSAGVKGVENASYVTEDMLRELDVECGGRDIILRELARALGMPSRRVGFYGVPLMLGHSATEVKVDGAWMFFDATAGIYFSRVGDDRPLSIMEARRLYPDVTVWQVKAPLFTARWSTAPNFTYAPLVDSEVRFRGRTLLDIERTYFASRMAGADDSPIFFTDMLFDLNAKGRPGPVQSTPNGWRWELGQVDGRVSDLYQMSDAAGMALYKPMMDALGSTQDSSVGRRFLFLTDTPRSVEFSLTGMEGTHHPLADLDHAEQARYDGDSTRIRHTQEGNTYRYHFTVYPPSSEFRLWLPGDRRMDIDAYRWTTTE